MTISTSNALIKSFGVLGMKMELCQICYTYNFRMDVLVNSMCIESAEKVFDVMEKGRVGPDVVTYNIMIKGYCKSGKTRDAKGKLREMEMKRVGPDKITYLTLIQACYSEEDIASCRLEIPSHVYSLVISGLVREGKCYEGFAVFDHMMKNGCKANAAKCEPDEVTYGVIVNCLCKAGKLDMALEYLKFGLEKNIRVNAVVYSSIIDGLGKGGRIDEAEKLYEEMLDKGCTPDSYCYNTLIDAFTKCGKIDEASTLFKRMEDVGCDQTVYTYTILISGLFKEHKTDEALALSTGLCLSGKVAKACKILDELASMGVIPDIAFEDMIHVCELADGIVDRDHETPGRLRTVLINALRKAGNIDLALKLMHS
ncbi:hypothetical protein MKX01_006777 [Papaver californicum]|nr:hypothetical protein MKX01_006777 [Papaver californicum]